MILACLDCQAAKSSRTNSYKSLNYQKLYWLRLLRSESVDGSPNGASHRPPLRL